MQLFSRFPKCGESIRVLMVPQRMRLVEIDFDEFVLFSEMIFSDLCLEVAVALSQCFYSDICATLRTPLI